MLAFVKVAEHGGFAPAARELKLSTSAVSRQVMELEDWLDVQLFNRTTRHVSLTDAGREYLDHCKGLVSGMDELEVSARDQVSVPRGRLRVTAPVFMGKQLLGPLLPGFLDQYPEVSVELQLLDRFINLIDEGFDLALRIGDLRNSTLMARKLGDIKLCLVASPNYVKQAGKPKTASDLKRHNCIVDTAPHHGNRWPIGANGKTSPSVSGNLTVNSGELVRELALADTGIALLPEFFVANDLAEGKLVALLERYIQDLDAGIFLVYPQTKHVANAVRAFIDYVSEHGALANQCS
ncbi:MAG: LysR family transcriptional regulator [Candidatus Thiodiazotropha sp. (ex Lucinoma borealis)]|nr:LysR family transcriptional regulator [Candidatus Thiodiazotropha sp. (ex Lucinoma borealis)]